jgi:ornithine cyclodeaminase/alanine dehydrogenase-like protein (mu-crystallin family)
MDTLVIGQADVRRLLPIADCIEVMAGALVALAAGDALQPLRAALRLPGGAGLLGVMPAYLGPIDAPGIKVITVYPGNHGTELDSHQGAVLLFEGKRGQLVAVIDATEVTAIRTAAVSAVATRALARDDAGDLALLGSGTQARTHLAAMAAVRRLRRVRVWSRDQARAAELAARAAAEGACDCEIAAVASARDAVSGADLVCTTTAARTPVLEGAWLAAGAHVNAVGACVPSARELDGAAVARARLFVDRRESALAEAGDVLLARGEGAIGDDHIAGELGEVLAGSVPGRRSADEITLFKSLGIGVEDIAAAHFVHQRAREQGAGTAIALGGGRA